MAVTAAVAPAAVGDCKIEGGSNRVRVWVRVWVRVRVRDEGGGIAVFLPALAAE